MCGPLTPGVDAAPDPAATPISMRTVPLAVVGGHDGGGLDTITLTPLPVEEFSVPETHVLWQPAAQSKQAVSGSNFDDARERRK